MKNINEWNLGELLDYAQYNSVLTSPSKNFEGCHFPYNKNCVSIGLFAMQTHSHDTGYSTRVYIIGGDKPYLMLNGTYWKRSGYEFNKFTHEHGAWDDAFDKACEALRQDINLHINNRDKFNAQMAANKQEILDAEKSKIESLFTS